MKILVTGIEGYIGSLLVSSLIQRGYEVVGLDTGFHRVIQQNSDAKLTVKILKRNIQLLKVEDIQGIDAVVHLAELSNDGSKQLLPSIICNIHYQDSMHLATIAKAAGVRRFVYLSSCSVYGVATDEYLTEESSINPRTPYATCKALIEQDIQALADDTFSPTFLRRATAFGASPRMRFDILLNNLAKLAWTNKEIKIPDDGTSWCPIVHVLDICKAILCTLEAPHDIVHNQIFNVGDTAHNHQVKEIAEIIAEAFKICQLSFSQRNSSYPNYRVSFKKIHKSLPGFKCDWDAQLGTQQLLSFLSLTNIERSNSLLEQAYHHQQQSQLINTKQVCLNSSRN